MTNPTDILRKVINLARNNKRVGLIRQLMAISNLPLRDCADAINECFTDNSCIMEAIRLLFAQYLQDTLSGELKQALNLADEHWLALGFNNSAELCEIVSRNYTQLYKTVQA